MIPGTQLISDVFLFSDIERLDKFKIGRRNRAAVFRLSLLDGAPDGADAAAGGGGGGVTPPRFLFCRAEEFSGMEGTVVVPTWMARALGLPEGGGDAEGHGAEARTAAAAQYDKYGGGGRFGARPEWGAPGPFSRRGGSGGGGPRLRVEPWLLPTCGGVKLKCITPGFTRLIRDGAAAVGDGSFDVTTGNYTSNPHHNVSRSIQPQDQNRPTDLWFYMHRLTLSSRDALERLLVTLQC